MQTSYVITNDKNKVSSSYKCRQAKTKDIPVVTPEFINECIKQTSIVDHRKFALGDSIAEQNFQTGKIKGKLICLNLN